MKWLDIRDQFPNSWEIFKTWIEGNFQAPWETDTSTEGGTEIFWNFYEYTDEALRDRMLFDFFDSEDVHIWTEYTYIDEGTWASAIAIGTESTFDYSFKSRVEAENDCYKRAFKFLEKVYFRK